MNIIIDIIWKSSTELFRGIVINKNTININGLHLTTKGVRFYNTNIISSMKECYEDTKVLDKVHESPAGSEYRNQQNDKRGRGGGENNFRSGRGYQHGYHDGPGQEVPWWEAEQETPWWVW